jgi:uncharacterized protein (DUF362 family)
LGNLSADTKDSPPAGEKPAKGAEKKPPQKAQVYVVEADKPSAAVLGVLSLMGGIEKFVKKGSTVVVKPNIAWEKPPEMAATTNPEVTTAIIKECFRAGAKKVKILERPCNDPARCYKICGYDKVISDTGAEMVWLTGNQKDYQEIELPLGKALKTLLVAKEALECDTFINVPIAKHHGLSRLTLGMKNLMGIMGCNRGAMIHNKIGQKLADTYSAVRPHLTIIDAYRVLVRNGPTGGKSKDVVLVKKIIASTDTVAADSYAATLEAFGLNGEYLNCVKAAYDMGLGEMDISKMNIIEKKL